ncbi:MAG: DUF2344 domain-containing protein [Phycisphaerales bacterium]|nr:DUF2344 domain-containing protein [Phycisphaerales bacterium]
MRFIAHNDMVRLFARALARSGLPVSHTAGFNPRMRMSLPFPRPVGQSSDVERLVVDMQVAIDGHELTARLQPQMPAGIAIKGACELSRNDSSPPRWVRYSIQPVPADPVELAERVHALLASEVTEITRVRHKDRRSRVVDIRPFIDTLHVAGRELLMSVYVTDAGSATPSEVCGALGMEADAINHLVRRVEISWQASQPSPTPQQ